MTLALQNDFWRSYHIVQYAVATVDEGTARRKAPVNRPLSD